MVHKEHLYAAVDCTESTEKIDEAEVGADALILLLHKNMWK